MKCILGVRRRRFVLTILGTLFALTLRADTIELKTGERIDGAFRQAGAAGVLIETAGQSITIPLDKVQAIYFGSATKPRVDVGPTPYQDAIDALRALRSVAEAGINYQNYSPRVLEAKVKVDRYLSSAGDTEVQQVAAMRIAMREYQLASEAWNASISNDVFRQAAVGKVLAEDPDIAKCAAIQERVQAMTESTQASNRQFRMKFDPTVTMALIGQKEAAVPLWTCAAVRVQEAERLLTQH
jgi:hypothetical protein